jgi:hypothetical protein
MTMPGFAAEMTLDAGREALLSSVSATGSRRAFADTDVQTVIPQAGCHCQICQCSPDHCTCRDCTCG